MSALTELCIGLTLMTAFVILLSRVIGELVRRWSKRSLIVVGFVIVCILILILAEIKITNL